MNLLGFGFYCGLSILYPYTPVYCPTDSCMGECYGTHLVLSKSAPLPPSYKLCTQADIGLSPPKNWFQWKPRDVPADRVKSLSTAKVCYLEDRGEPHDINELEKDQ